MGKYMGKDWNTVRRETKERGEGEGRERQSETTVKKSMGEWCNWERGSTVEPSKTKDSLRLEGKSEVSPPECHPSSTSSCCTILGNLCVLCSSVKGSTANLSLNKHQRLSNCEMEVMKIYPIGRFDCPIYYKIDSLRDLDSAVYSLAKL